MNQKFQRAIEEEVEYVKGHDMRCTNKDCGHLLSFHFDDEDCLVCLSRDFNDSRSSCEKFSGSYNY